MSANPLPLSAGERATPSVGSLAGEPHSATLSLVPGWGSRLNDPGLAMMADSLDDLERVRNASRNRLRTMTRSEVDKDGNLRGFCLSESDPEVARLSALCTALDGLVHDQTLALQRRMRKHPLGPWVKGQRGIGDKTAARLLAAVGDPYWNTLHDRPRTVSELWAYCGLHTLPGGHLLGAIPSPSAPPGHPLRRAVTTAPSIPICQAVAARRRKGVKSNWSTVAKTRAWLCIEACMKQLDPACKGETGIANHVEGCRCSPYRIVVDVRRTRTLLTHPDWTPRHSLNDGMRIASKTFLRDLWRQAKALSASATLGIEAS